MDNQIITEEQLKKLKEATYVRILSIIDTIEILLDYAKNPLDPTKQPTIAASGLYTHAIEEFGKLCYLKNLKAENGRIVIDLTKFKGKQAHEFKFKLALSELPKDLTIVQHGSFTSSGFTESGFITDTITNWVTRLRIFNTDIDKKGNVIHPPLISLFDLSDAVLKFKDDLLRKNY